MGGKQNGKAGLGLIPRGNFIPLGLIANKLSMLLSTIYEASEL